MEKVLLILSFMFSIIACTPKVHETAVDSFNQATSLKAETEQIQQNFKENLKNLRFQRNNIMVQGRTLTAEELNFIDKMNEIISYRGELTNYLEDIEKSENAYEPNGKEQLYLNQQANKLAIKIEKKIQVLQKNNDEN